MQLRFREVVGALGVLIFCSDASAEWRCDCTSIVGSCSASAAVRESFIEVTSNVEQCARVDYFVDGIPFVALVVDGSDRQDWIARSESPEIIVQSCQICLDNSGVTTASTIGAGLVSDGEPTRLIAVTPEYPAAAAAAGIEGFVEVRFSLSPSGTVVAPEVVAAEPAGVFEGAALTAVSRWRYTLPAGDESPTITERVEFNLASEILSLSARNGSARSPVTAREPLGNSCVREESRYDFGDSIDVSLINACDRPLVVFSCAAGTGSQSERWVCRDPETTATLLGPVRAAATANLPSASGNASASLVRSLEISHAPKGEYWWLACSADDTACRDSGRQWVRSVDRQNGSIDPQDRTRASLARSF